MASEPLQAPFPYFGGKSAVAADVWAALGDVDNYVEPFAGSCAVLLARPHEPRTETINDADGLLANFWRAVRAKPLAVAKYADWPVNECDTIAREVWLVGQRESLTERLMGDSEWCDPRAAGWWVYGAACYIAGGFCSGKGPWQSVDGVLTRVGSGPGVSRKRPHLTTAGTGVHRPHHELGPRDRGECQRRRAVIVRWMRQLSDRLRNVRVCCGDWSRVTSPTVTYKHGLTGVFLDPPYSAEADRDMGLYAVDCGRVAHDVREWAIAEGRNRLMRIVLAGYEGEHAMPDDWRVIEWRGNGGYANQADGETRGKVNRGRERLWLSPHCLRPTPTLFDGAHDDRSTTSDVVG